MRFDLERWGDGTIRLVHWDSLHGQDVVFRLERQQSFMVTRNEGEDKAIPIRELANCLRGLLEAQEARKEG